MAWNNDDYVQVNERIEAFYKQYPDGSLQSEIVEMTDSRVTVKAYAYRDREDTRPAVGHSYLGIPGSTNFTRGSELENAETSAWGRALAALGFEVKRGIASKQEVQNKRVDSPLVREAKALGATENRLCPIHEGVALVQGRNKKWGHVLDAEAGTVCYGEAA